MAGRPARLSSVSRSLRAIALILALFVCRVILLRVSDDLPPARFFLYELIGSSPQHSGDVLTGPKREVVGLNAHAQHSRSVSLNFIDEDPKSMRIVFGMMLATRGHSRFTYNFVSNFESALAQVSYERLGRNP
jgi:hypothetical protein